MLSTSALPLTDINARLQPLTLTAGEGYGGEITCPLSGLALTLSAPSSAVDPSGLLREPRHGSQVKRDLHRIGGNLILVVFPFKNRDQQSAALRNWDLWGPMVRPTPWPLPIAICKPQKAKGVCILRQRRCMQADVPGMRQMRR